MVNRRKLVGVLLGALIAASCGTPLHAPMPATGVRRADAGGASGSPVLTLATYNVRNLLDQPAVAPDGAVTKPKPVKERVALGESFRQINADVVALAEVQSLPTLQNFRDTYLANQGYRHAVLIEGNDLRGIDVGLLSRIPVVAVKSHKDVTFPVPGMPEPQKLCRDLLQVDLAAANGYRFTVFVAHLKSHYGGDAISTPLRIAEARTIRHILDDFERANPGANYCLCGDMNDTPDTEAVRSLIGGPDPAFRLMDTLAEIGTWAYTYYIPKYRSRIDYLLLSRGMANEYVSHSAYIWKGTDFFRASDHLPSTIKIDTSREALLTPPVPPAPPVPAPPTPGGPPEPPAPPVPPAETPAPPVPVPPSDLSGDPDGRQLPPPEPFMGRRAAMIRR